MKSFSFQELDDDYPILQNARRNLSDAISISFEIVQRSEQIEHVLIRRIIY